MDNLAMCPFPQILSSSINTSLTCLSEPTNKANLDKCSWSNHERLKFTEFFTTPPSPAINPHQYFASGVSKLKAE